MMKKIVVDGQKFPSHWHSGWLSYKSMIVWKIRFFGFKSLTEHNKIQYLLNQSDAIRDQIPQAGSWPQVTVGPIPFRRIYILPPFEVYF